MNVPFVNLRAQHEEVRNAITAVTDGVINHSAFIGSERVSAFENPFAQFCGVRHAVSCASGTEPLRNGGGAPEIEYY